MRNRAALCALLSSHAWAQTAPTVTLAVTPTAGTGSVTPVATWSSTGVTSCVASGGWTGTKATSGTQTLPAITASTTYSLVCSSNTGTVTVGWDAPTENTDGTPLTNLSGYKVYRWTGSAAPALAATVVAGVVSVPLTGIPAGPSVFAVTAFSPSGESSFSSSVTFTVAGQSVSKSASVTVTVVPKPPTNPVVTQKTAYQVVIQRNKFAFVPVGTVPLNAACVETQRVNGYYVVPRWRVTFSGTNRPEAVVARCG